MYPVPIQVVIIVAARWQTPHTPTHTHTRAGPALKLKNIWFDQFWMFYQHLLKSVLPLKNILYMYFFPQ